jgi:alpha-1,6-mannosyltransferase
MTHHRNTWFIAAIALVSWVMYLVVADAQQAIYHGPAPGHPGLLAGTSRYMLATLVLFVLYVLVLALCARGNVTSAAARLLAFGCPVAFNVLFVLGPPRLSGDVLSYIAHGQVTRQGGNPYMDGEGAIAGSEVAGDLAAYGWRPGHPVSPYGPLWTGIEAGAVTSVQGVGNRILAFKAIATAASLASAALVWLVVSRVRPERRQFATLAYLWNPMMVIEFSGEGHNDALVTLFVLLALALAVRGQDGSAAVALWGGVLIKYLPLVFLLLLAVRLWQTRSGSLTTIRRWAGCLAAMALFSYVTFRPWWEGWATFEGLRLAGHSGQTGSTVTLAVEVVARAMTQPPPAALLTLVSLAILGAVVSWAAYRGVNDEALLSGCAAVALTYLLLVSPNYWPWYATVPVATLLLVSGPAPLALALALSLGSRLAAPFDMLYEHAALSRFWFLLGSWLLGIGGPLLAFIIVTVRRSGFAALRQYSNGLSR